MKHKQFLLAGLLGLSLLSLLPPSTLPLRGQLLEIRRARAEARARAAENLKNQFTPGYKCRSPWGGLSWNQGEIFRTQTATNLAINGAGCFGLQSQGEIAYTRDGRFAFQEGVLCNSDGWSLLGMPVDEKGNIVAEAGPIRLQQDPCTKLYGGRFTGFHFDETGKLFGECTLTDPVTGQQITSTSPLYQVLLFQFPNSGGLADHNNLWTATQSSGRAISGLPGQAALGALCPASLELSNVDFLKEGATLAWLAKHERALGCRETATGLPQQLKSDKRLRQAVLDNLAHQLSPGYRCWDLLGYLQTGQLKLRNNPGLEIATGNAYDLALRGEAYLVLDSGEITRNGHLIWSERGLACGEPDGPLLMGYAQDQQLVPVRIPPDASNLEITPRGEVRWIDFAGEARTHFRLALATTEGVTRSGAHLRANGQIGYETTTRIQQGCLETSNGDLYEEGLEAAALLELAGLPPFPLDDLGQPDARQRALTQFTF